MYTASWLMGQRWGSSVLGGLLDAAYNSLISKAVPEDKRGWPSVVWYFTGLLGLPMPWLGRRCGSALHRKRRFG